MVFDVFGSVRSFLKFDEICIDNNVFRLHYKFTVIILVVSSVLVTSRQYFGDPIDCISRDDVPPQVMDTYCWIHGTFTIPDALGKKIGSEVPHPGVEKYTPGSKRVYHKYYQWVCFALFFQAMFFYVPRYLWKMWEGGRLRSLILGLNSPIMDDDSKREQISLLANYMRTNLKLHDTYLAYFVLAETLNFLNVIIQMYFIDLFLGGAFSTYGIDVLRYAEMEQEDRVDPMIRVFPRMTKCTFYRYGSSGDVQKHDALCILPLNIINEKIYIFLWFWLVLLAILSSIIVLVRFAMLLFPQLRYTALKTRANLTDRVSIRAALQVGSVGDWFMLYMLCKNMDPLHFRELMQEFYRQLNTDTEKKPLLLGSDEKSGTP